MTCPTTNTTKSSHIDSYVILSALVSRFVVRIQYVFVFYSCWAIVCHKPTAMTYLYSDAPSLSLRAYCLYATLLVLRTPLVVAADKDIQYKKCVRLFIVSSNLMAEPLCPSSLPPLFDRLRRKYIEGIAYGVYVFACVVDSWGFLQENSGVLSCRHTSFTRRSVFRLNSNDLIYKSKSINATQHTTHRSRARSMSIAIVVETRYD